MATRNLYIEVPESLADQTEEQLEALATSIKETMAKVATRDPEVVGDLSILEFKTQNAAAREALQAINKEIGTRAELQAELDEEIREMLEEAGVEIKAEEPSEPDPGEPSEPSDPTEPEVAAAEVVAEAETITEAAAETALEPVLASGNLRAARPRPPAPTKRDTAPESRNPEPTLRLVASGLPGFTAGADVDGETLSRAMLEANYPTDARNEKVLIARADFAPAFPEERKIGFKNEAPFDIMRRIGEIAGPAALTASGGLCAPVTPYYGLANVSVASRPVRDSLVGFNANRGGLQFASPATLADVAGGVGIKTAAQDEAGGTNALKNCLAVSCPDFDTVTLEMIYRCLQFGNLNQRAFPELIAQWTELAIAYHARVADSALLDYIGASSTAVTAGTGFGYGTSSRLIDVLLTARDGLISRNRMDPNARMRWLAPFWSRDAFVADVANGQFDRFGLAPGDVDGLLRRYGVDPTWYLDTETGAGQVIGAQGATALVSFPNTIVGYLFPEGSFLFLDGGTLDLGIVRDSTLNSTNDFQIFAETFEAAAFIGVESIKLTITACENGTVAALATAYSC